MIIACSIRKVLSGSKIKGLQLYRQHLNVYKIHEMQCLVISFIGDVYLTCLRTLVSCEFWGICFHISSRTDFIHGLPV